ncbi:hypothetical protein STEG23_000405 [Scotinomys teguina]
MAPWAAAVSGPVLRSQSWPGRGGAAFLTQTVCLDDTTVKFEIWDTAGQERYHSLAPMYYRGAQAAIVVYDITNEESFARAKNWVKELQRQASPNIVIALSGNKADLANKRAVDFQLKGASVVPTQKSSGEQRRKGNENCVQFVPLESTGEPFISSWNVKTDKCILMDSGCFMGAHQQSGKKPGV